MVWYIYHQNYLPYLSINSDETSYNYPGYNFAVGLGGWILIFTLRLPKLFFLNFSLNIFIAISCQFL